jgi:transcriptional regulator with XRE-family HTH domain
MTDLALVNKVIRMPTQKKKSKAKSNNQLPFGKILRQEMKDRGLTVRAVGELSGVSPSVVQGWLNNVNPHNLYAVSQLAESLGMSFRGLLLGQRESLDGGGSLAEILEEKDYFEGICRVKIQLLTPREKRRQR